MTTTKKDYYEILGIPKTATDKEIKAAYRRLARKHHPDVNPGDGAAEEKFKEVAEAFAVLSSPEKRAKYDRGGHEAFGPGFDPFAGFDFDLGGLGIGGLSDLFELFGGGARGRARRARPGADVEMEIRIPFRDAVRGATIEVPMTREGACPECGGSGVQRASREVECPDCGGTGRREQRQRGLKVSLTCPRCQGAGRLPGAPCGACGGSGRVPSRERTKVRIPAGVEDGERLRVSGRGQAGRGGGPPGNAYLVIRVEPDPVFRREGRDLLCDVTVGIARAALGGKVAVPTLDKETTIGLPAGTRSGQKLRLKGRGVPASGSRAAGDLYAVIQIAPPKSLDPRSRELLEEFARLNPPP